MNKTYKSVWNESTGTWVATDENASARKKSGGVRSAVALTAIGLSSVLASGGAAAGTATTQGGVQLCSPNASGTSFGSGATSGASGLDCKTAPNMAFSLNNMAD